MTSAQNQPPGRGAVIAAIHAFADWLAVHPEVPAPTTLQALHSTRAEDEADEATRMAAVIDWAKANDAQLYETAGAVHGMLRVFARQLHGVEITYDRYAFKDDSPRRYVDEETERASRAR